MEVYKRLLLLLLLIGIIAGPGYLTYCEFFSGEIAGNFLLYQHEFSNDGGRAASWAANLKLTPDMNTLSVAFVSHFVPPVEGKMTSKFQVAFRKEGKELWLKHFIVPGTSDELNKDEISQVRLPKKSYLLEGIKIPAEGYYQLQVQPKWPQDLFVHKIIAKIRKNVIVPDPRIYGSGFVCMFFGLLGMVYKGQKINRKIFDYQKIRRDLVDSIYRILERMRPR